MLLHQKLPNHGHSGMELTVVLSGAFKDSTGEYGAGDFQEIHQEGIEHAPIVRTNEECICLVVTDSPLKFNSLAARLVQPLIGI